MAADTYTDLLKRLIATPSVSRSEDQTADVLFRWLRSRGVDPQRIGNNVWALSDNYDPNKSTVMLNSHHDTVPPAPSYTIDPYTPIEVDGKIYGLGSNDAGGSVVALAETFCRLRSNELPFNLLLALSAEEEVSGEGGIRLLLPHLERKGIKPDMAIVGEPTDMNPAIGERGLVVLDCIAHGKTGHAARNEGVNAIYIALDDIDRLRKLSFPHQSPLLGPVKISVTMIEAGRKHNVVPEECRFVVDVRTTDAYTNDETVALIRQAIVSDATPRSTRIHASAIAEEHPMVRAAVAAGGTPFVSPTTSDMALMPDFPTLKLGPGNSSRSHAADEYICRDEIDRAIDIYSQILTSLDINHLI